MDAITVRKMVMPSLYLQGKGAIYHLGQKAFVYGDKAFVVGGKTALEVAGERIKKSLVSNGIEIVGWKSDVKECTHHTINKFADEAKHHMAHFIIGVGGGRAIDTAKAVAARAKVPAISVGTQCATNADCSAESVIYSEDHKFLEVLVHPTNPVLVIEDTEILARAPVKYLVWGMGDALSAKFESEAFAKARERRKDGTTPTAPAVALANACYSTLMEHGPRAVEDLKNGNHSHSVDEIIEAVKLSSALAFENSGCALAHALHNGLIKTGQVKGEHGEIVAYCTLVQVIYENRPEEERASLVKWCGQVGLPTQLSKFGTPDKSALRQAAEWAAEKDANSKNMPEKMKVDQILKAIEATGF